MLRKVLCLLLIAGPIVGCSPVEKKVHAYLLKNSSKESFFSGPSLDRYYAEMERFFSRADADMWSQYAFQDSLFATGDYFPDPARLETVHLQRKFMDTLARQRAAS